MYFGYKNRQWKRGRRTVPLSLSKNSELASVARKQRYAGLRGKRCGTRVRDSVPQPQSSSLALPCQILVSVDGCQSLAAFGSCIHWMRAPSRRPITPAGTGGKRVPSGHNRRRRLATRRCDTKRAGTTAVVPATIEWQQCLLHLHFWTLCRPAPIPARAFCVFSSLPSVLQFCHTRPAGMCYDRKVKPS